MAMIVACGVILAPKAAMAEDVASTQTFTVDVPQAVAWVLNPSGTTFAPLSQDFNFTGRAVANNTARNVLDFGAAGTSYVITNDTATSAAETYQITFGLNTSTVATISQPASDILLTVGNADAQVTMNLRLQGQTTNTVLPTLGGDDPTVTNGVAGTGMLAYTPITFGGDNQADLLMALDLNEATLTEADAPTTFNFNVIFTALDIDE